MPASLTLFQLRAPDGRLFVVDGTLRLGRDPACQVHLDEALVSRVHATVWPEGAAVRVRDEGSSNGTFCNGERLEPHQVYNLRAGDTLRLGRTTLTVEPAPQPARPAAQPVPVPPPPSAAERAASDSPPTVHMPVPPRPGPAPASPARQRGRLPALALAGCASVCLLLVCATGGLFAVQRPPFLQTALAQLAPATASATGVTVLPAAPPPTPLSPEAFSANQQSLAAAVGELNLAQLDFIHKALGQAQGPAAFLSRPVAQAGLITDEDFAFLERKGLQVYFQANQQGQTVAAQGAGNDPVSTAMADVYAAVAQQALVVTLKVNDLRQGWQNGTLDLAQVAALMADASALLWNPAVTEPATPGNPFAAYAADPAAVPNPAPLDPADLTAINQQLGLDTDPLGWLAAGPETGTQTLTLPALDAPLPAPLAPNVLAEAFAPGSPLSAEALAQVAGALVAQAAGQPNPAAGAVTIPLRPVVVADPSTAAASGQAPPAFPGGKGVVILPNNPAYDSGLVGTLFGLDGSNTPTVTGDTPIAAQPAVVVLTLQNLSIKSVNQLPKGSSTFEGEVVYEFDVNWTSSLTAPQFELDCVSGNHFAITAAAGTQHISAKGLLLLYPGAEDAYCYASRNGNTLGSASLRFLVGDPAQATQRAVQVETDSVALNLTLTADALGTQAAAQTRAAATLAATQTEGAVSGEVAGTQTAEFILTVTALAGNAGPFATQTAAALAGDDDGDGVTNANDRCADQPETANGWRDEDGCPDTAPIVNLSLAFTEELQNGPVAAFASTADLAINFGAGTTTGTLSGSGSWDGTYNCFNTSDPSEIYQIVGGRYTGSYQATVTGTANAASRTYQGTIDATGVTRIRFTEDFTHPECVHLNGTTNVDNWTGAGTINGTWDGNTFATLTTEWRVRDIGFFGTGGGAVTLTEP